MSLQTELTSRGGVAVRCEKTVAWAAVCVARLSLGRPAVRHAVRDDSRRLLRDVAVLRNPLCRQRAEPWLITESMTC